MNKVLYSFMILILMVVTSCNDQTSQPDPVEPKDTIKYICPTCPEGIPFDSVEQCPLFYDPNHPLGMTQPTYEHDANGPSANGDLIVIGYTTLLNIQTLQRIVLNEHEIFPKDLGIRLAYIPCVSPKNNDIVLMDVGVYTTNEAGKKVSGRLLFKVNIHTKEYTNITPSKFGIAGEEKHWGYSGVHSWSYDEATSTDRLHFSDIHGTYIVQEDRFIDVPTIQSKGVKVSPDNKYRLVKYIDHFLNVNSYTLNGVPLPTFDKEFTLGYSCAWSKDSRYLAIAGYTSSTYTNTVPEKAEWGNIWVFDLLQSDPFSSTFTYKYKINPRKQFCKYLWSEGSGRQLAIISPNTLAVALQDHTGGGLNVHEITFDGKYVRQLTFEK